MAYVLRVPAVPAALSLTDNAEHTVDIPFPEDAGSRLVGPFLNGNIAVGFKTKKGTGTNSDGLTVTMKALVKDPEDGTTVVVGNTAVTIVSALDWTTLTTYLYPISDAFGPCRGIRLGFTYANGSVGVEEMSVVPFILYE